MSLLRGRARTVSVLWHIPPSCASASKYRAISHVATRSPPHFNAKSLAVVDTQFCSCSLHTGKSSSVEPRRPSFQKPITSPANQDEHPGQGVTSTERTGMNASAPTPTSMTPSEETSAKTPIARQVQPFRLPRTRIQSTPIKTPMHTYKEYHLATTTVYTQSEEEANDLIGTLKGPLGSLVDWPVFFWPDGGPTNQRTNLVQLCDEQTVLLIHVGQMIELPKKLSEILENPDIPKIGVNVLKNGEKLFDDFGVACANLIELGALAQHAVHQFNISPSFLFEKQVVSLEEMTARFQAGTLAKLKRRALNWIRPQLSEEQIGCVANNTYSALMVYKKLLQIAHNKKQRLEPAETSFDIEREPTDVLTSSSRTAPGNGVLPLGETTSALVPRRQMRAYILWHVLDMSLNEICAELRSRENPLAYSTVVSYILGALRADPDLPFDIRRLETLVRYDPYCWKKYKKWFWRIWFEQRDKRAAERDG